MCYPFHESIEVRPNDTFILFINLMFTYKLPHFLAHNSFGKNPQSETVSETYTEKKFFFSAILNN